MLLRGGDDGGTKLVIVATINANPWHVSCEETAVAEEEFAVAVAVTSRRYAKELGLNVIAPVEGLLGTNGECVEDEGTSTTTAGKVQVLLDRLRSPKETVSDLPADANPEPPGKPTFTIHCPRLGRGS